VVALLVVVGTHRQHVEGAELDAQFAALASLAVYVHAPADLASRGGFNL
jgi:hypothetical protein